MLGFVTSLPHPANCVSYRRRSELLVDTLRSVLRQTHPDFRVVVVVNEEPECRLPDDARLEIVRVGFPPPDLPIGRPFTTPELYADKGAKLGMGTAVVVRHRAEYVMFFDSDDYIHRGIADFASRANGEPGWYSDSGFFHIRGERTVTAVDHGFHQRNGSTHVLRTDLVGVPEDVEVHLSREETLERIGRVRADSLMGRHRPIVKFFEDLGEPLTPLPFPAAIWEIGTGENFSRVLAVSGRTEPVAGRISEEFGLPVPSHARALASRVESGRARVARRLTRRDPGASG